MIYLYATLIINKRRKFSTIPENLQESVEKKLRELGYDTNGDLLTVEE